MKTFAAIDFETANNKHSSVCSVGVVIVRRGRIVNRYYSLIRPQPNFYLNWFTDKIHGISRANTDSARPFPEVRKEVKPLVAGLTLVAHNSPFDEGCLRAAHKAYGLEYPGYRFRCTCRASRAVFGAELPNHQLQTSAAACGYDLAHHHHALADAEACAAIALKIL
ncbi:MAG: DNA polymerase III subunit epsilon [Treponematales bacterium]